ncbi:SpoIIE family protein phosphatase [Embleya scabrispora]|uniref:SpoIIE family protein phosphatase n=1 Tax=Embleya scabrispora TaxID=159449 RepID=UPI000368D97C|nr:SpoIIE family protein phosphatase [Embleya scabrispora]MYS83366.1 SpoIIE family protein phosphatase [Streptomyces sp. SID5474]
MEQRREADRNPGDAARRSSAPGSLFDLVPSATWVLDADGRIVMWSAAAEQLFGYRREDILGARAVDLVHPPFTAAQEAATQHAVAGADVFAGSYTMRRGDGTLCTVESRAAFAEDLAGNRFVLITSMDSTVVRKVEADLAIREALFDQSPIGVGIFDADLRYVAVNDALAAINRMPVEEHIGRRLEEVRPGMDTERVRTIQQRVLETGEPVVDSRIFGPIPTDGSPRTVWSMSYNRLEAPGGRILGISCSLIDVTERHYAMVKVDAARKRLALLNEAGTRLGATLDIPRIAEELTASVVPGFADLAAVDLLEAIVRGEEIPPGAHAEKARLERVASRGARPGRYTDELLHEGSTLVYAADSTFGRCLRTGGSYLMRNVQDDMYDELIRDSGRAEAARALGLHTMIVVPLSARGVVLGTMLLGRGEGRPAFDPDDLTLATELGARAAVSVDNARLYHHQRETAVMLQRSLLPQNLPELPGISVAHRYLPGSSVTEVGGDWYDVIPLSGGRIGLVVGDVMGHGVHAAAVMGQLRTAVRTLAGLELPPAEVLGHLDDIVVGLGELHYATCVYVVYDPVARACEFASAGHMPPVLVPAGGRPRVIDNPPGTVLGVGGLGFEQGDFTVESGSTLVLYTDGLVETRDRSLDVGIDLLCDAVAGPPGTLGQLADKILADVHEEPGFDDVALLVARLDALAEDSVASWWLPAEPAVVSRARELSRKTLTEWGLDALIDITELLVSELVTNALRYGAGPIRLRLLRGRALLCEVADAGTTLPRMREAEDTDEGGRGLQLVNQLAERWGSRKSGHGKTVWFELTLPE